MKFLLTTLIYFVVVSTPLRISQIFEKHSERIRIPTIDILKEHVYEIQNKTQLHHPEIYINNFLKNTHISIYTKQQNTHISIYSYNVTFWMIDLF